MAKAFIPNPLKKPCVNHKDGIKNNDHHENLEWVTVSENTKHAFDNGLAKNAKGFDDSQSHSVAMYNYYTDEFIACFGSVREAHRMTGCGTSTIARGYHRNKKPKPINVPVRLENGTRVYFIKYDKDSMESND